MDGILILVDERGRKYAVPTTEPVSRVEGLGTFHAEKLQANVGRRIAVGDKQFFVLLPSNDDLRDTMARGPQALTPKDLGAILYGCDIVSGATIVEAGTGSGALTVVLARAVGARGKVVSYDVNPESLRMARANVERAGVMDRVQFREGDVRHGIQERNVDAVLLDLPDPWAAVDSAWDSLRPCGHLGTFSPNMEQVKETVAALRRRPFVGVRTIELIEREMEVREVGVRPSHAPLGHTGYLTFARKVLDTF